LQKTTQHIATTNDNLFLNESHLIWMYHDAMCYMMKRS